MTSGPETPRDRLLQIGEVADRVGLSLRTVRYYEEMGLVEPETRTGGGFRLYTQRHIDRLAVIRRMKPLGFTVEEMRDLLDARDALRADPSDEPARERLAAFAAAADERSDVMRAKLSRAEELVAQLRDESRKPRGARRGSRRPITSKP